MSRFINVQKTDIPDLESELKVPFLLSGTYSYRPQQSYAFHEVEITEEEFTQLAQTMESTFTEIPPGEVKTCLQVFNDKYKLKLSTKRYEQARPNLSGEFFPKLNGNMVSVKGYITFYMNKKSMNLTAHLEQIGIPMN
jgi:hypothetical protein